MAMFTGGDVPVPMAAIRKSADDSEGEYEGCRLVHGGVPVCYGRLVLCFP